MERKKLTRDQTIIKLVLENEEQGKRIKGLEKEKKDTEKRLDKLEKEFKRFSRLLMDNEKNTKVLKEKSTTLEHEVASVKNIIKRRD